MAIQFLRPVPPQSAKLTGWILLSLATVIIVTIWSHFSGRFYDQVIPFYDSLSYQEGYFYTTQTIQADGPLDRAAKVWRESGNNVVLYKLFAAVVGDLLPHPKTGLYVYLFGIHIIATLALFHTISRLNGSVTLALAATAAWWATTPFGLLRDGIGDQRIDLSSGSLYLLVSIGGLRWLDQPTLLRASLAGFTASLAMLHRPVMALQLGVIALVFFVAARLRHPKITPGWSAHIACAIIPIAVIALPWLITHFEFLRSYYLEYNVDQGHGTFWQATSFNAQRFGYAVGPWAALILFAGLVYGFASFRLDRWRTIIVALTFLIPFFVIIGFRAIGNMFAAQMPLAIPMLGFACFALPRPNRNLDTRLSLAVGAMVLAGVVGFTPLRLERSLSSERPNARPEVEAVIHQIVSQSPSAVLAAFHDQPVNNNAFASIARDMNLKLRAGFAAYHPYDFGLTAEEAKTRAPTRIRTAISVVLKKLKQSSDLLILPTEETQNRLWTGLFSHQMIPEIRRAVNDDPEFTHFGKSPPVDGVEFDLYRLTPET